MKPPRRASVAAACAATIGAATVLLATPASAGPGIRCHGLVATIVGDDRSNRITGTSIATSSPPAVATTSSTGAGGNDVICGGRGRDFISAGAGNDEVYGGLDRISETDEGTTERIGDWLAGGPGSDLLDPGRDTRTADEVSPDVVTWAPSRHPVHIDLAAGLVTGDGRDRIIGAHVAVVGSRFGDLIEGSSRADRINAGGGADTVRAGAGNDVVYADSGAREHNVGTDDQIWGGAGDDQLSSGGGDDVLRGGPGNDVLDDHASTADALYGGRGRDLVVTELAVTAQPQIVDGGSGADSVSLMTNRSNPTAQAVSGTWDMTSGALALILDETLTATVTDFENADLSTYGTSWVVTGTNGNETLRAAGTSGTTFHAMNGDDQFMGSASDDVFDGGGGTDRSLAMGEGNDTCRSVETLAYPDCENIA